MAARYETLFIVEGKGSFPIDMLRYDGCVPERACDSLLIEASIRHESIEGAIHLRGPRSPEKDRWNSFGWVVTGEERRRVA